MHVKKYFFGICFIGLKGTNLEELILHSVPWAGLGGNIKHLIECSYPARQPQQDKELKYIK